MHNDYDYDMDKAKELHRQLIKMLEVSINTSIDLLETVDEKPTLVQILGSITAEVHDILIDRAPQGGK